MPLLEEPIRSFSTRVVDVARVHRSVNVTCDSLVAPGGPVLAAWVDWQHENDTYPQVTLTPAGVQQCLQTGLTVDEIVEAANASSERHRP